MNKPDFIKKIKKEGFGDFKFDKEYRFEGMEYFGRMASMRVVIGKAWIQINNIEINSINQVKFGTKYLNSDETYLIDETKFYAKLEDIIDVKLNKFENDCCKDDELVIVF